MAMSRVEWDKLLKPFRRGFTYYQVSERTGKPYYSVRYWMKVLGYPQKRRHPRACTGRKPETEALYKGLDFDHIPNSDLAKIVKRSRERLRQIRAEFGKPKVRGPGRPKLVQRAA